MKNGTIQHSALAQIWREYPQEIYSSLLFLLQKFEICYLLEDDVVEVISLPRPFLLIVSL